MRGLVLGCLLLFCAALASAEDAAGTVRLFAGGFAPTGANFEVAFEFSDLQLTPPAEKQAGLLTAPRVALSAAEWTNAKGIGARLEMCCVKHSVGLNDGTFAAARLHLVNSTDRAVSTTLSVRIAPRGEIRALSFENHIFFIGDHLILLSEAPSRGAILADSPFSPRPLSPQDPAHVESAKGECRGEMLFDLTLPPGQTQTLGFVISVQLPNGPEPTADFYRALTIAELFTEARKQGGAREQSKP